MSQPQRFEEITQVNANQFVQIDTGSRQNGAHTRIVRRYYEQNTKLFFRLGGASSYAIHRAVWGNGVKTFQEAINYSNTQLVEAIHPLVQDKSTLKIADLGCGLGGSLFYLAQFFNAPFIGIGLTISPSQAKLANEHNKNMPMRNITFLEGDFFHVPLCVGLDVAYSIEAFCHAPESTPYLNEVARLLRPGGRWVICDDFLNTPPANDQHAFWLDAYKTGWRVPNIHTVDSIVNQAQSVGLRLIKNDTFTHLLRLRTLPHRLASSIIKIAQALPFKHEIIPSMVGSLALQHCLKMGIIDYRFLVFERVDTK